VRESLEAAFATAEGEGAGQPRDRDKARIGGKQRLQPSRDILLRRDRSQIQPRGMSAEPFVAW